MRYGVAIGAFLFCFLGVAALVLTIGAVLMLLLFASSPLDEFPPVYWWITLPGSALLGLAAGWHSFRATLRYY